MKKNNFHSFELIERFHLGQCQLAARQEYRRQYRTDPEFAELARETQSLISGIRQHKRQQLRTAFREQLRHMDWSEGQAGEIARPLDPQNRTEDIRYQRRLLEEEKRIVEEFYDKKKNGQ